MSENHHVYLDPPYASEKGCSFVGYTKNGFVEKEHTSLFNLCDKLTDNKIKMMMTNADVSIVRNHFQSISVPGALSSSGCGKNYYTQAIDCRRAINSKNPGMMAKELIIKNYS